MGLNISATSLVSSIAGKPAFSAVVVIAVLMVFPLHVMWTAGYVARREAHCMTFVRWLASPHGEMVDKWKTQ